MAGQTISAHIDDDAATRLREIARGENRPASQIVCVALKSFLELPPGARRAAFSLDGDCSQQERALAARLIGRATLRARQAIIESRQADATRAALQTSGSNTGLRTEEEIEAEAVRSCRT